MFSFLYFILKKWAETEFNSEDNLEYKQLQEIEASKMNVKQ